jgi:preprotein translocase subunit Sec63
MPSEEQGPSYYAVLNVSRDASDEEIKKAFRNLAQTYHPDKHSDPARKAEASASFTLLQEAYEVTHMLQFYAQLLDSPPTYTVVAAAMTGPQ